MKNLKSIIWLAAIALLFASCEDKNKETDTAIEQETSENVDINGEKEEVRKVMQSYKSALESLTTDGTFQLFTDSSKVYESGGVEGTYKDYIDHHLGPELGHFESFDFSEYTLEVDIDLPYAFTTETYIYTIVLNQENDEKRTIQKKGLATSILKKMNGEWKIIKTHSSSRDYKPKQ